MASLKQEIITELENRTRFFEMADTELLESFVGALLILNKPLAEAIRRQMSSGAGDVADWLVLRLAAGDYLEEDEVE
jgi:hypothetical protein